MMRDNSIWASAVMEIQSVARGRDTTSFDASCGEVDVAALLNERVDWCGASGRAGGSSGDD
eukprot:350252-Pleurochrysis_carterae.AAC.1